MTDKFANGYVTMPIETYNELLARVTAVEAAIDKMFNLEVNKQWKTDKPSLRITINGAQLIKFIAPKVAERVDADIWELYPDPYFGSTEIAEDKTWVEPTDPEEDNQ